MDQPVSETMTYRIMVPVLLCERQMIAIRAHKIIISEVVRVAITAEIEKHEEIDGILASLAPEAQNIKLRGRLEELQEKLARAREESPLCINR